MHIQYKYDIKDVIDNGKTRLLHDAYIVIFSHEQKASISPLKYTYMMEVEPANCINMKLLINSANAVLSLRSIRCTIDISYII